jgi:hypothetical protein
MPTALLIPRGEPCFVTRSRQTFSTRRAGPLVPGRRGATIQDAVLGQPAIWNSPKLALVGHCEPTACLPPIAKASTATGADVATRVAWVEASRMTRDCLTHSVAEAQQTFMLIPFASMRDCITYTSCEFDLIVYHSHDDDGVNLSDAIALREVFSSTPILVLSDASMLDHAVVRDVLDMGASGLVPTRRTGLGMPNKLIAAERGRRRGCTTLRPGENRTRR